MDESAQRRETRRASNGRFPLTSARLHQRRADARSRSCWRRRPDHARFCRRCVSTAAGAADDRWSSATGVSRWPSETLASWRLRAREGDVKPRAMRHSWARQPRGRRRKPPPNPKAIPGFLLRGRVEACADFGPAPFACRGLARPARGQAVSKCKGRSNPGPSLVLPGSPAGARAPCRPSRAWGPWPVRGAASWACSCRRPC